LAVPVATVGSIWAAATAARPRLARRIRTPRPRLHLRPTSPALAVAVAVEP